ncbi:hypothetical protein AB0E85_13985, partial [Streptomyces sp. NPDC029044]|uniref:hypothetical protein n=1 Tax=Streptomyces sp. NPDC029044 TaxID=3157198 RepID=UPI0033CDCA74
MDLGQLRLTGPAIGTNAVACTPVCSGAAGGVRSGYDQVNVPDEPPASQVEDAASGVAPRSP